MLGLGIYEAGVCNGCGLHRTVADDRDNLVAIEEETCNVCKDVERYGRIQGHRDRQHEDRLGENAPPASPRPSDGRRVTLRVLSAAEAELRRRR